LRFQRTINATTSNENALDEEIRDAGLQPAFLSFATSFSLVGSMQSISPAGFSPDMYTHLF